MSSRITAATLTTNDVDDASEVGPSLDQVMDPNRPAAERHGAKGDCRRGGRRGGRHASFGNHGYDDDATPGLGEELLVHGGHLALAGAAGAAYGALTPRDALPIVAGSILGGIFYALAYGLIGPTAKVSQALWRDNKSSLAQHGLLHLLFGITTAFVAKQAERRL